jgi:hypothetical protein
MDLVLLLTELMLLLLRKDNKRLKIKLGAVTVLALLCKRTAERLLLVAIFSAATQKPFRTTFSCSFLF